jgi:hypothetical protein
MSKIDIAVVDDFFNEKELNILVSNLNRIQLKHGKNDSGTALGFFSHNFNPDKENKWLFDKIKKTFFKDIELKAVECSFRLRHSFTKVLPHIDSETEYNFLCYLKGKSLLHNGTGFYNNEGDIDRYVGFEKNRVLFFDSNIRHTNLQALGESSPRYTLNIFYRK